MIGIVRRVDLLTVLVLLLAGLLGLLPAMTVELVYRDGLLGLVAVPIGTVLPGSSWRPSPGTRTYAC